MTEIDFDSAVNTLAMLKTADEVADFLHFRGITGVKGSASRCPIARAIGAVVPDGVVIATPVVIEYRTGDDWLMKRWNTPPAVSAFIRLFDQGYYRELWA